MQPLRVAIAVHDVSPATWRECRELLSMLDHAGARPLSLLVIPHYHFHASVVDDRAFRRALDARLASGDELVLHGLFHVDAEPAPRTLRGWVERRLLTRCEGEFAALSRAAAAWRIERGIAMFRALQWPLHGFVPPAWLMSEPARAALAQCGHPFTYMTVRSGIYRLPEWRYERTANLCYSPSSALRRAFSALAIRHESRRARDVPLLRLSLHPQDARVPGVLRHWERLVSAALAQRQPVTKCEWAARIRAPDGQTPLTPGGAPAGARAAQPLRPRALS
jgi:uncharacterized protein